MIHFPNPRKAPNDIVAIGGDLDWRNLIGAYRKGIFPWPIEGLPLTWFSPWKRAILEFDRLHIPRSLEKARRRNTFRFTVDRDFPAVIRACAKAPRPGQDGTWIFPDVIDAYCDFHQRGWAHSVEVWNGEDLVGGMYGVSVDGTFAGESMFHRLPNASKLALLFLVDRLASKGLDWIDIQVMTPHMQSLGARLISRAEFLDRLSTAQARNLELF
ncbi:MAG: leucyl/phenylalanyl-tRNA--protein transferase [Thermoanaerobaculia bacterium]